MLAGLSLTQREANVAEGGGLARQHLTTALRWELAARLCLQTKTTGGGLGNGRLGSVFKIAAKLQTSSGWKEEAAPQKPSAIRGKP